MDDAAIEFSHVSVVYDDRIILNDYSASINRGDTVVISGPSGSGKSTLLYVLLGYVQPISGEVRINGEVITAKSIWNLRKQCAYVAQRGVLPDCLVWDYVREYLAYAGAEYREKRIEDVAHSLCLSSGIFERSARELSGGEQQRLALLIALLSERPLLLLDEVTASVDSALKKEIVELVGSSTTKTVISVSHDSEWTELDGASVWDMEAIAWKP